MHTEFHLLQDIVVVFALASFVIWIFHKLKIPSIIGFLLTGVLTGPHAFGLVSSIEEIEILAEIGVVLLLFTIGIEFSLKSLIKSRKMVLLGGSLQVFLTGLVTFGISRILGMGAAQSVFFGFLVALSSTAVVLKVLQERAEINQEYGRFSLGVLIFQDLIIVPMILLVPILAGSSANIGQDIVVLIVKVVLILVLTYLGARFFVPWMLHQVARTKSQELFLLTVLMFGLGVAWFTSTLGLSLALGAFLAGLIISESDYSHQAFGNIIPLRDIFISFFFVSIGMLFDFRFVLDNPVLILISTLLVLFAKTIISGGVAYFLGFSFRATIIAGLALSQVGEFSFILASLGEDYSLIDNRFYQAFITIAVITMSLSPFIIIAAPKLAVIFEKMPFFQRISKTHQAIQENEFSDIKNHLLIIGMGLHGHNVAMAAESAGIDHLILDFDPDIVKTEKEKGKPIFFGDAHFPEVLNQVGVKTAEVVVITPSNSAAAYSITSMVREMNPRAYIIVRARQLKDLDDLLKLGANEVIPEEFETSVEIFSRVLAKYMVPRNEIAEFIKGLRAGTYERFRMETEQAEMWHKLNLHFPDLEVSSFEVHKGSYIAEKQISTLNLPAKYQINVIALRRQGINTVRPNPETEFKEGDIVYVLGSPEQISAINSLFETSKENKDKI